VLMKKWGQSSTVETLIIRGDFDYTVLPVVGLSLGAIVAWRRHLWAALQPSVEHWMICSRLSYICQEGCIPGLMSGEGRPWSELTAHSCLRFLSTNCSDHAPLILSLNTDPWARLSFRFKNIWCNSEEFLAVVQQAWKCLKEEREY